MQKFLIATTSERQIMAKLSPNEETLIAAFRKAMAEVQSQKSDLGLSQCERAFLQVAAQIEDRVELQRGDGSTGMSPLMIGSFLLAEKLEENISISGPEAAQSSSEAIERINKRVIEILGQDFALTL